MKVYKIKKTIIKPVAKYISHAKQKGRQKTKDMHDQVQNFLAMYIWKKKRSTLAALHHQHDKK